MAVSAQRAAHAQVLDALLLERLALALVSASAVELERARLRVQRHALGADGARLALGLPQQRARQAATAGVAPDAQAAEAGLHRSVEDDAAGSDQLATVDRHHVQRIVVEAVAVGVERDPLLLAEHLRTQRQRGGDLGLVARQAHLHAHAMVSRRTPKSAGDGASAPRRVADNLVFSC